MPTTVSVLHYGAAHIKRRWCDSLSHHRVYYCLLHAVSGGARDALHTQLIAIVLMVGGVGVVVSACIVESKQLPFTVIN